MLEFHKIGIGDFVQQFSRRIVHGRCPAPVAGDVVGVRFRKGGWLCGEADLVEVVGDRAEGHRHELVAVVDELPPAAREIPVLVGGEGEGGDAELAVPRAHVVGGGSRN